MPQGYPLTSDALSCLARLTPIPGRSPLTWVSQAILGDPRFPAARVAYVRAVLGLYEHDPFLNRLLMELGRFLVFATVGCLHAASDEADRETWPTMRLLKRTMNVYGDVSSPRRIEEIVARFVETGYLHSRPTPADRRARILVPSDRMVAHDVEWLAAHYLPLDVLFPDAGYAAALRRDPGYRMRHRAVGRTMIPYAAGMLRANEPMALFMARDAGIMILMKLLDQAAADPEGTVQRVSFADLGERFGISRTHVRNTLQAAERAALVGISGDAVTLLPPLAAAFGPIRGRQHGRARPDPSPGRKAGTERPAGIGTGLALSEYTQSFPAGPRNFVASIHGLS